MPEAEQIKDGRARAKRFDKRDFNTAAEFICDDLDRRKNDPKRRQLERQWDDIDRQVEIRPDLSFKHDRNGQAIEAKRWMPEMELPDQAQALEVITADARRMTLPPPGEPWFSARVELTDEYLDKVNFTSLIAGDDAEVPSEINQENADRLAEGWIQHHHRQYDFGGVIDGFNAGAFKYGTGIGRARLATKPVYIDTARGVERQSVTMPRLFPWSIRNVYLDDSPHKALNEGVVLGPAEIATWKQLLADLVLAASKGSSNPDRMDGGWMPAQLKDLRPDKTGHVEIAEYEGDLVVPRKTTPSMVVRNFIWTVVKGQGDARVVRLRKNPFPFSSWVTQPYHIADPMSPYGVGPLMLNRPNQIAGTEALNRLMAWAILNIEPPIQYDRDDAAFEAEGGPRVEPGRLWRTLSKINIEQIGDGAGLLQAFAFLQDKSADVTGVDAPRLGAQTVSHTTAFAKEAELSRGTARTVDYVTSLLQGGLTRWLHMEYEMSLKAIGNRSVRFYSDAYGGFLEVKRFQLPDRVTWDVFGAGGPAERQAKAREKATALQLALQVELTRRQLGEQGLDLDQVQRTILREGGFIDLDPFFAAPSAGISGGAQGPSGVAGGPQVGSGPAIAALQAVQGGGAS